MFEGVKKKAFRKFKEMETELHELNYLFWECTTRCNLNCLHCGSDCAKDSVHPDMPQEDFFKALDTIENPTQNFLVVITGGEPLLRKDLAEIGYKIRKRGMRWGMVSNGQLYSAEKHNELLNAGMGALTISFDGLRDNHSWLRNSSTNFDKVENAIKLAVSSKRLNFDIVTCVNNRNFKELDDIYHYLLDADVKAWRLFTIAPIGRAKENNELMLTDANVKALMDFIVKKRKLGVIDVKFSCEAYLGSYDAKAREQRFFCRAGINIGSVLIDGSISACPNIDRSFAQGNIYKDNLWEVWQNRYHEFRDRSWNQVGQCKHCDQYKDCQGNGFHYWHGEKDNVLQCHYQQIQNGKS